MKSKLWLIGGFVLAFFQPTDIRILMNARKYNLTTGGMDTFADHTAFFLGSIFGGIKIKLLGYIFILLVVFAISYVIAKKIKHPTYNLKFLFSRISFSIFLLLWAIAIPDFFIN